MENLSKSTSPSGYDPQRRTFGLAFLASLILFLCVLGVYGTLWYFNDSLHTEVDSIRQELAEKTRAFEQLRTDRKILGYSYYSTAKPEIEGAIRNGTPQRYIAEIQSIEDLYKIRLSGFSFMNDRITTSAVAPRWDGTGAIDKIIRLTRDYREDDHHLFRLDPVYSVGGDDLQRTFSLSFTVNAQILARQSALSGSSVSGSGSISDSRRTSPRESTSGSGISSVPVPSLER